MVFLQPMILWALPAVLIPVGIHLLNRMRYRTVPWAALMFLQRVSSSSTRNARLRHYLILACRMMTVLLILLALARPVIGGRLGLTLAGPPETVVLLLDRSLSMETQDARQRMSKREKALAIFREAALPLQARSRFVLIESVLRQPQSLAALDAIDKLGLTGPTDTGADIPAMFQSALDYLLANRTGRTEIWFVSDMQASNWDPDAPVWQRLTAAFAALPMDVRVRIVPMAETADANAHLALHAIRETGTAEQRRLHLTLDIGKGDSRPDVLPLTLTVNGAVTQHNLDLSSESLRWSHALTVGDGAGWGYASLPADANARDNLTFFTFGGDARPSAGIVSDNPVIARVLAAATSPLDASAPPSGEITNSTPLESLPRQSMLIWQRGRDAAPATADALRSYIEAGGVVLLLPPDGDNTAPLLDIGWRVAEDFPPEDPMTIAGWERRDGPLAATADGRDLPFPEATMLRRRIPIIPDGSGPFEILATYRDGEPFVLRRTIGQGFLYLCSTLPQPTWSSLADGMILVPMLQRMMSQGGNRTSATQRHSAGEWRPETSPGEWRPMREAADTDPRWTAGVYRRGNTLVAVNTPAFERQPEVLPTAAPPQLLSDANVSVLDDMSARDSRSMRSEVWPALLALALACMAAEMTLLLPGRKSVTPAQGSTQTRWQNADRAGNGENRHA